MQSPRSSGRLIGKQLMQMDMERTEVAAVIAGADPDDAGTAGGLDAGALDGDKRGQVHSRQGTLSPLPADL